MKVNANFQVAATAHFDPALYMASPALGVHRFLLDRIGNEKARATTIVEYAANSKFPAHTHLGGEEFVVLQGTFKDEFGEFPAGTYVRNPIDSKHAPWVDGDGCTIFVKLLQMAEPPPEEKERQAPVYINLERAKLKMGQAVAYGTAVDLYDNPLTAEHVEICYINRHQDFPSDPRGQEGGEELFVLQGSLFLITNKKQQGDNTSKDDGGKSKGDSCEETEEEEFKQWDWLRFPVGAERTIRAGVDGAQVYRKTGHLTERALRMEKIQIADSDA